MNERVQKPWGYYDVFENGETYRVKKLFINPGEKLSLQKHNHRSENWIIAQGTGKVLIGNNEKVLNISESIYIPKNTIHRVESIGEVPLVIIEVWNGDYLGEDDIERFEDDYGRIKK